MTTIMSLPYEIYDIILGNDCLDLEDLIRFRNTCKYLNYVCSTCVSNRVWRKHFFKRWPGLKNIYEYRGLEQDTKFLDHSILRLNFKKKFEDFVTFYTYSDHSDNVLHMEYFSGAWVLKQEQKDCIIRYVILDEIEMMIRNQHLDAREINRWFYIWWNKIYSQFKNTSQDTLFEKRDFRLDWTSKNILYLQLTLIRVLRYIKEMHLKGKWKM